MYLPQDLTADPRCTLMRSLVFVEKPGFVDVDRNLTLGVKAMADPSQGAVTISHDIFIKMQA